MKEDGLNHPKKRKKYKPRATIGKGSREVFEIVKSHWPVTAGEIMKLQYHKGSTKSGHNNSVNRLKVLKRAGLVELKRTGLVELKRSGRVYVAWPKDVEKLRNDDLRNGLLGLREAVIQVVDSRLKERTRKT